MTENLFSKIQFFDLVFFSYLSISSASQAPRMRVVDLKGYVLRYSHGGLKKTAETDIQCS